MSIGFFTSQDMPRWPRISINSLEEQYFIGHLLQAGRNGNFDGIPKICYWWTPLVGGFKGSKDGDPLRSAAVRSLPALCAGWQHICTVATMFVLDCCHRLSWGILILVGTWECLVPLVPEGLSKVAEFLKTSSLWMFFWVWILSAQRMNLIGPQRIFCSVPTPLKHQGGMRKGPAAPLRLHLHAIFHIVTTMSPYCYVVFMTYHRCLILKREAEHRLGIGLAYVHVKETAPWLRRHLCLATKLAWRAGVLHGTKGCQMWHIPGGSGWCCKGVV